MITKDSNELFNQFKRNEIAKHAFGDGPQLLVITNITNCFTKLLAKINRTPNSIFIIRNETESMEIVIRNEITDPDRCDTYIVTISNSSQTYQIEEIVTPIQKYQKITIISYEKQFS